MAEAAKSTAKKSGPTKPKSKSPIDIAAAAEEILRIAQERGVERHFFFVTTFKRYQVQMRIMTDLEREIGASGTTVEKSYVRDRTNLYIHPAVAAYNSTANAANKTVETLIKIVNTMVAAADGEEDTDELTAFLTGRAG